MSLTVPHLKPINRPIVQSVFADRVVGSGENTTAFVLLGVDTGGGKYSTFTTDQKPTVSVEVSADFTLEDIDIAGENLVLVGSGVGPATVILPEATIAIQPATVLVDMNGILTADPFTPTTIKASMTILQPGVGEAVVGDAPVGA